MWFRSICFPKAAAGVDKEDLKEIKNYENVMFEFVGERIMLLDRSFVLLACCQHGHILSECDSCSFAIFAWWKTFVGLARS